jgi:hypothetical protein
MSENLKALAKKANPGPWSVFHAETIHVYSGDCEDDVVCECGDETDPWASDNALYIAAVDPQTVLGLLFEIEQHEQRYKQVLSNIAADQPNGDWLDRHGGCRVCGGEIPHGHTENCDHYKLERKVAELQDKLKKLEVFARNFRDPHFEDGWFEGAIQKVLNPPTQHTKTVPVSDVPST